METFRVRSAQKKPGPLSGGSYKSRTPSGGENRQSQKGFAAYCLCIVLACTGTFKVEMTLEQTFGLIKTDTIAENFKKAFFSSNNIKESVFIEFCHVSREKNTAAFITFGKILTALEPFYD